MDTRAFSASFGAPSPGSSPAVTRWTAQLADGQAERDYRLNRFAEDRRRSLLLVVFVAVASELSVAGDLYGAFHGVPLMAALARPLATTLIPLAALALVLRTRTPFALEWTMVVCTIMGVTMRMTMLTFHPEIIALWPAWLAATLFIIYLYLPVRLVVSVAMATIFSAVAVVWWWQVRHPVIPLGQLLRGLLWLLLINALGFVAANWLHRSQRIQFAQSQELQQLLSTDALTGIPNRRSFDGALGREWRRCARAHAPLSLLMIDVDHFKAYNDRCGHQQGDACLRQVARLLLDAVGRPGDLVARYGGEEFVCLLPEVGQAGARAVATRLIADLHRAAIPHPDSPLGPRLTISIGVATATELAAEAAALMALADKLLYVAKRAGRNRLAAGRLTETNQPVREARAA